MAELSEDLRAQLLQQLQADDNLTDEELVSLLNRETDNAFVRQSQLDAEDDVTSFFKRFSRADVVDNRRQIVTQGLWAEGRGKLTDSEMFTYSPQINSESGNYFYEVYNKDPSTNPEAARVQFALAYGNGNGGGSERIETSNVEALEATKGVYFQHRNVLITDRDNRKKFFDTESISLDSDFPPLGSDDSYNTSGELINPNIIESDDVWIINISRSNYKQKIDPGNWELRLRFEDKDDPNNYSTISLIDELAPEDISNQRLTSGNIGRSLDVVWGSLNLDNANTNIPDAINPETYTDVSNILNNKRYGEFYPDLGVIILDPNMIQRHAVAIVGDGPDRIFDEESETFSWDTADISDTSKVKQTSSTTSDDYNRGIAVSPDRRIGENADNPQILFDMIERGSYFVGRSAEEIRSTNYFIRVRNTDFNFSNNPTFITDTGELAVEEFEDDPQTFITTIGFYDDDNTLVAVAKLSKPVQKNFQREQLIQAKLSY